MPITRKSAKSKGVRLQNRIVRKLHERFGALEEGDIKPAVMGESGIDIILSPAAKKLIPFDIESKNQERLNIWAALSQAKANAQDDRIPAVVFSRNRSPDYIALPFDAFLDLLCQCPTRRQDQTRTD